MSPCSRNLNCFHRCLSLLLVVVLVLPPSFIILPTVALAAPNTTPTAQAIVPTPVPTPSWPGVADQPPYQPVFTPPQPPETRLVAATAVVAATTETAAVDTEAGKTGVVVGAASATLTPDGGQVQLGALQLRVASAAGALTEPVQVQADVLPSAQANALSPVGLAFTLHFAPTAADSAATSAALQPRQPLQLTVDYSQIPLRYGGSFADRLTLYRVSGCKQNAAGALDCATWAALRSENDRINQHLTVTLAHLTATSAATETVTAPDVNLLQRLYLPLVNNGGGATSDDTIYVLAAAANGQQGDYTATPFAKVSDYQVSLATGAAQTSYPIPVPPAAGGLAPQVVLRYDSGSVDGMSSNKNNQPGWVGIGWSLESGYISRRLKTCGLPQALGDLCLTGNNYSIVLNGISSRLVNQSGNLYYLQNDPRWKVEQFTNGVSGNPDTQKEYWIVTTPDGTKYRFGGEINPDTGSDQNSVFYVPVYSTGSCTGTTTYPVCNKAYQWNLDRVEDTNGNVISYTYNQEINYYLALGDIRAAWRLPYVQAGYLSVIEYGRQVGQGSTVASPTRVNFIVEDRCIPGSACSQASDFPDTPLDLACGTSSTLHCLNTPTFWSKKRLKTIETQYNSNTNPTGAPVWVSVAQYALSYTFPVRPAGTLSEQKLWLNTITQQLGNGTNPLPSVQYSSTMLNNRRDYAIASGVSPVYTPRINQITNQLGGVVTFTYGKSHECPTSPPYTEFAYDCYPAWNTAASTPAFALWNKWKVLSMTVSDSFSGNAVETYTYAYSTPVNHYDDDPVTPVSQKSYSDFRGSAIVTVTDASGAKTEHRFYRGMNGDTGNPNLVYVILSNGTQLQDDNWFRGREIEVRRLTSASVAKQRTVNWFTGTLTAGSGTSGAYFVAVQQTDQTTSDTTSKTFSVQYAYDTYGNVTYEARAGDTGTTGDERTIQRSYLANTTAYIVNKPAWEKLWVGAFTAGTGTAGQEKSFTEYAYDTLAYGVAPTKGNLTKVRAYSQTTPTAQTVETTTAYDTYGRPTSVTDARGKVTTTAYHAFYGYVTSVTNALNQVTSTTKDPGWGVTTQTTDPNNNVTNLQYDGYGRLTKVWLPTEPTSGVASYEFVYDAAARPANVKTRQLQVKASSTYLESWSYVDGFGRTLQTQTATSSGRSVTNQNYNNLGQLVYQTAPYALSGAPGSGYVIITNWNTALNYHQFYRDEVGRLTKDETRYLATVLWSNQTIYNVTQTTEYDALNHRRDTDSDAFGHLLAVTEYNVGSTFYNTFYLYDTQGNLTQVTDNANNVTTISYDLLGRKTAMTDPDMGSWQYQYDAVGNLTGQKDGRNQWVYLAYDDLNRLSNKRQDNPTTGALIADYTYDATGQKGLLSYSRAYGAQGTTQITNVTYDTRNRLTQQTWSVPGTGGGSFRMDYAYNEADQRTSLTYPGGNAGTQGESVTNSYNAIGQLTGVSGSGVAYVSSATYNAQGQLTQLVNENGNGANGLTRQWSYETNTLRLSTLQAGTNATFDNLQKLTYSYDNAGNVTSLVDTVNSGQKQCFQYDWLSRLTAGFTGDASCTVYSATGTGPYNHTYGYDGLGNITSNAGNAYTYGDAAHKHAVTAAFGNSYGYDANGNQTTRTIGGVTYTFTYDYENHLTAVSGGSISASFVYDADGNRVKGTVNGTTTVYIAGLYEYQGGATTLYYEGNALRRTGYATDNGVFYLLQDQLKSSSVLANQNGTVNSRNYFYPYGGNRGGTAFSALTTKRFTGQYQESSLPGGEGLSYYGARWYDAQLGRFASPDSLVPSPGNPQAFNRYSYVKNNPLGRVDPTGHYDITPGDDPYWRNTGSSSGSNRVYLPIVSNQGSYVSSRPTFWPPFLPYPYSLPPSLSKKGIASWVSQNNISTTVGVQFGFDACVGFWVGGCGSGEVQASFNWWSGELAYTLNQSSAGRIGSPGASLGLHAGATFTTGASDIGNAILGASRFTSIDGSVGTPIVDVSAGGLLPGHAPTTIKTSIMIVNLVIRASQNHYLIRTSIPCLIELLILYR